MGDNVPSPIAPLGPEWPVDLFSDGFRAACEEIAPDAIVPILAEHSNNDADVVSFYPWAALALYRFKRADLSQDVSPKQFADALRAIRRQALELYSACDVLEDSVLAAYANTTKLRGFVRAYRSLVMEFDPGERHPWVSIGDDEDRDFDDRSQELAYEDAWHTFVEWKTGLVILANGAWMAADHVEGERRLKTGIAVRRGERVKGLDALISILGNVWIGLTGRRPSAARVGPTGNEPSAFVRFVHGLAKTQHLKVSELSRKRIELAIDRTFRD